MQFRPLIAVVLNLSFILTLILPIGISAQSSKFNYQGKLNEGGTVATGTYSMKFSLYDADTAGTQIGSTITETSVAVTNGIFSVALDFGTSPFTGSARYLEIEVKKSSDVSYITLSPRQEILASPYSVKTLSATSADSLSSACVGCVIDLHITDVAGSKVTGTVASATTAGTISSTLPVTKGGTGSTTQNFVDLSENQTVAGDKEFTGKTKFTGDVEFVGKMNMFKSISGTIYPFFYPGSSYAFAGGANQITLGTNQTVAASATAALGTTFPSFSLQVAICYQDSGGTLYPLGGYQTVSIVRNQRTAVTITATNSTLAAGSYYIGFCAAYATFPLDYNDVVSGWVMVFQN